MLVLAPPLRLAILFGLGTLLGSLLNLAAWRLAWHKRAISPWSRPPPEAPRRRWTDRLPIVGWIGLRRESAVHGPGFWVRPMVVEIALGLGLAWLYWWEVLQRGLVAGQMAVWMPPPMANDVVVPPAILHATFFAHALLMALMVVAALIDVDEKMIPDAVTVPGTVVGLTLAAALPWSLLPQVDPLGIMPPLGMALHYQNGAPVILPPAVPFYIRFLTLNAPNGWPAMLAGVPQLGPLALALGCFWLWCGAMAPRPWYGRHGWKRACQVLWARFSRAMLSSRMLLLVPLGTAAIVAIWWLGGPRWAGLVTALVGLVGGGGIVWSVRLIGAATLRKEAMGFGDVTLMMMIGTFLGWQPCLVVFFLAPFAGLVVGVMQWLIRRDQLIPYGPFLCLATVATMVLWAKVWTLLRVYFAIGWLVPAVLIICLPALWIMLWLWHLLLVTLLDGK